MAAYRLKSVAPLAVLLLGCAPVQAVPPKQQTSSAFEGVWSVEWCDKSQPRADCGDFTALLVQDGSRLCGRFNGARPGLTQIDDGNPRSVVGTVVEGAAVVAATSGRNQGTYLVRLDRVGKNLRWHLLEQVGVPGSGDIEVLAVDDVLVQKDGASDRARLGTVRAECMAK